jgi:hypothetical protein
MAQKSTSSGRELNWWVKTPIQISDILETRRRGIKILVTQTGKAAWIPRRHADFYPGKVFITWGIAKEILK